MQISEDGGRQTKKCRGNRVAGRRVWNINEEM